MVHFAINKKLFAAIFFSLLVCTTVCMFSRVYAASGTNIALNKEATASCSMATYSPDKAVDGSIAALSRWYCATGPDGGEKWLQVDLGSNYNIDGYSVTGMGYLGNGWEADLNPRDFRLQKSTDGTVWVDADAVTNNSSSVVTKNVAPFQSRYVRLYVDYGNQYNNTWTSVMDFQVFGHALSSNAALSDLMLSSGAMNETFASGILTYTQSVGNAVSNLTVTPTVADAAATVQVKVGAGGTYTPVTSGTASGSLPLAVGVNTVYVQVTAQDGTTVSEYTVTVSRLSNNTDLSELMISNSTLIPAFASNTTNYSATVSESVYSIQIRAIAADTKAKIKVNGNAVTESVYLDLDQTENEVKIVVTAEDHTYTKLYTINITKLSSKADIQFLNYGSL
ncbi:MAG: Cadherin-like beta sandwich domain protein, partial [Paenibacillus sp.]|nr:Cadherin-like beta sandwich domain protein [Paenibacillus sp.]